ncbi:phage antirepressor protein [Candidatus Saccharibacteria bacterium]|nr:phage antirepressor protein [Candidatus Saccharibacteria bacterium]
MTEDKLQVYNNQPIRTVWDEEKEEWLFSVVDVVSVLTEQSDYRAATKYWNKTKTRLLEEGSQLSTNCRQLKMTAKDGKKRMTDVATVKELLRLIQSIPSKKAEPFKLWLAKVGAERIEETIDPEQAIDRALETYLKKGYSEEWVHQRLLSIRVRNELTEEWGKRGMKKGIEYAILTDEISKAWSGMTTREYKNHKGLKKENLRDNMTDLELVLTMLSEATTTEISKIEQPQGLKANKDVAKRGGTIAGNARKEIEVQTGQPVITKQNRQNLLSDILSDS